MLALAAAGAFGSQAQAEIRLTRSVIVGVVSHVDESGLIHLDEVKVKSSSFPDRADYVIRQWALDISPEALALIVDGREVTCDLMYEADAFIVADCKPSFTGWRQPDGVGSGGGLSLQLMDLASHFGLGRIACSAEDAREIRNGAVPWMRGLSKEACLEGHTE